MKHELKIKSRNLTENQKELVNKIHSVIKGKSTRDSRVALRFLLKRLDFHSTID